MILLRVSLLLLGLLGVIATLFAVLSGLDGDWTAMVVLIPGWLLYTWAAINIFRKA